MVINDFLKGKSFTSIFYFTETIVDNPDFQPIGVKIISKQRKEGEKKGGGLMLGYKENKNIILEEISTKSSDILAVEGKVRGCKIRIILT